VLIVGIVLAAVIAVSVMTARHGQDGAQRRETVGQGLGVEEERRLAAARESTETSARLAAFEDFLRDFPESPARAVAVSEIYKALAAGPDGMDRAEAHRAAWLEKSADPEVRGRLFWAWFEQVRKLGAADWIGAGREILADSTLPGWVYGSCASEIADAETLGLALADSLARMGVRMSSGGRDLAFQKDTLASILLREGRAAEARPLLAEAAQALTMPLAEIQVRLADACERTGDEAAALEALLAVLARGEDPEIFARAASLHERIHGSRDGFDELVASRTESETFEAPDFTLRSLDGESVRLGEFRGQVVLLNFWHPT
jgi:tetratricopeptide (TPR) repeat protein